MALLLLAFVALPAAAAAKLYRIPSGKDSSTINRVLTEEIPQQLQTATCGYPKDMSASDSYTDVEGLPLKPHDWPTAGGISSEADKDRQYPDNATGYALAIRDDIAACADQRKNSRPCNSLPNCQQTCDKLNTDQNMQYKVYRVSTCTRGVSVQVGTDANGDPIMQDQTQTYDTSEPYPYDDDPSFTPDCNTCPAGWNESDYAFVGTKYLCTSDPQEQAQSLEDGSRLTNNYGWTWGNGVNASVDFPTDACRQKWTEGESKEWPNCTVCKGPECRSDPNHTPPDSFVPPNGARYQSFYRKYIATHTLANIPDTTTEDQNLPATMACYSWYQEDLNLSDPGSFACLVYDPQEVFASLSNRKVSGTVDLKPTNEQTSADDAHAAFGFDPKKSASNILTPTIPPPNTTPPFGETPKYVTALESLEMKLQGVPPTVEMILPRLDAMSALADSGAEVKENATGASLNVTLSLQPGLLENVQRALRQAIFSRMEEEPVPVVLPLLSPSELLASIKEWEDWKETVKTQKGDTSGADEVIAKLKEYQSNLDKYASLRASLPASIATVLDRRKQLSQAIDEWVRSRMQPYEDALANQEKSQELVNVWRRLKDASAILSSRNQPYCKADSTTPPLTWLENIYSPPSLAGTNITGSFSALNIPDIPRHLVFDFSDIFIDGATDEAELKIPVLMPVLVSLDLPHPPALKNNGSKLPDLPPVPSLPEPKQTIDVRKEYAAATANQSLSGTDLAALITDLKAKTTELQSLAQRYFVYFWNQERDPSIELNALAQYPETRLWDVFMRFWAPVGAYLHQDVTPFGAMSSSSLSACAKGDDNCLLREQDVQDRLRITLPKAAQDTQLDTLRSQAMESTIDKNGKLTKNGDKAPPYDLQSPQDLYHVFQIEPAIPLEHSSSSSSSS